MVQSIIVKRTFLWLAGTTSVAIQAILLSLAYVIGVGAVSLILRSQGKSLLPGRNERSGWRDASGSANPDKMY